MSEHFTQVADAFTRKAAVYDAFGEGHVHLTRMREKVYDHIGRLIPAGSTLLELNAGTGFDAVNLVGRGYKIHATDLAEGMLAEIQVKIERHQLHDRLSVQPCSFTELNQVTQGPFDGIYSNFGGLNCIEDLTQVTRHLPSLLRPGGIVSFVIMPPICPWELAVAVKDWRVGTRRLRSGGTIAYVEGVPFKTVYFTVKETIQAFGPRYEVADLEGLSIFTPTADNDRFATRRPTIYRSLTRVDDRIARLWPFNRIGDFFILSMRMKG